MAGQVGATKSESYGDLRDTGEAYEKFLCEVHGWERVTNPRFQAESGDTLCSVEIKLDRQMQRTGNVFIETMETNGSGRWHVASIFNKAKHLAIGNYRRHFIVPRVLVHGWRVESTHKSTQRAEGFLVSVDLLDSLAGDGDVVSHWTE